MSSIDSNGSDRVMLAITEAGEAPARADYPPGDLAIWIFILAELLVFAIFFAAYAFTRMSHVELFNQYQATLDRDAALVNTLALLTSSYFVVRGVVAAREGANGTVHAGCWRRWAWAAFSSWSSPPSMHTIWGPVFRSAATRSTCSTCR